MRVAIVGCGLIGGKRARFLSGARATVCCDRDAERAGKLARESGAESSTDWQATVRRDDVDIVVVATTHDQLAPIAAGAARAGKHVLIEKPGARRAEELDPVIDAAAETGVRVRVGFNHRYHPALRKAREIFESGRMGPLMFIRGRYGHGGREGYEDEWRADREISGGGELVDQGTHLIDLAKWFLGDFAEVRGHLGTFFWEMPVEDNCFLFLRTEDGKVAWLHASWSEWKNMFSLEIYGRIGKLVVDGLGGSYGVERLTYYQMSPEMGPPEASSFEYPMEDTSWESEFADFLDDIRLGREPSPGLRETKATLEIVGSVYRDATG
ncbi:MAG: Gfo/Idh/MocA family oxidoreductase [bacterium]|nr:Gfo/Idh/MocA family oxidoreductase [bacterium]